MAVNRYDTPAQYDPVNTYVPLPFPEMAQAVAYRNQRADETQGRLLELEDQAIASGLEQIRIPGTNEVIDVSDASGLNEASRWANDYSSRLSTIGERVGTTDMSDPAYRREAMRMARELREAKSPTGVLGRAEENLRNYNIIKENVLKNPDIERNPYLARNLINQLQSFASSDRPTLLNPDAGIDEYKDLSSITDKYVQGIKPLLAESYGGYGTDEQGNTVIKEGFLQEISPEKIRETATGMILSGEAGDVIRQQSAYFRDQLERTGVDPETASVRAEQYANDILEQQVSSLISKYAFSTGRDDISVSRSGSGANSWNLGTNPTTLANPAELREDYDPYNIKESESKVRKELGTLRSELQKVAADQGLTGREAKEYIDSRMPNEKELEDQYTNEALDRFRTDFNIEGDYSKSELKDIYDQTMRDIGAVSTKIIQPSSKHSEGFVDQYANNINAQSIVLMDSKDVKNEDAKKLNPIGKDNPILDELGYSIEDFNNLFTNRGGDEQGRKNKNALKFVGYATDGPQSGMMAFDILDKKRKGKGEYRRVYITANEQLSDIMAESHILLDAFKTGNSANVNMLRPKADGSGLEKVNISINPGSYKTTSGQWKYSPEITIDGQKRDINYLGNILKNSFEAWMMSNNIGSRANVVDKQSGF